MFDIILTSGNGNWFWRIDRRDDDRTVEYSCHGYASPEGAVAAAKVRWEILELDAMEMAA